jgi:formylglycine-generating enzyme required for sulfatase activity
MTTDERSAAEVQGDGPPHTDMVWNPGGTFLMDSEDSNPDEAPAHRVMVDGFWMDRYALTKWLTASEWSGPE